MHGVCLRCVPDGGGPMTGAVVGIMTGLVLGIMLGIMLDLWGGQ